MKRSIIFITLFCFATLLSKSQTAATRDYRSLSSGAWETAGTWQVRDGSGNWTTATAAPSANNNVYIQIGHAITVSTAEAVCNDFQINTGTSTSLTLSGAYNLSVNGKIRAYTGTSVISGIDGTFYTQANSTTLASTCFSMPSTGVLKIVGNTRTVINTSEWTAGASQTLAIEFALNTAIDTAYLKAAIKCKSFVLSSGNVSTSSDIRPDNGTQGQGTFTIKSGTVFVFTSGTIIQRSSSPSSTSNFGTFTLESGATLECRGGTTALTLGANTVNFNGTVIYSGNNQTFLTKGTGSVATGDLTTYNNLILKSLSLTTPSTKTLSQNITVNGTLSLGDAVLTTGTNNLTLGSSASLLVSPLSTLNISGGITDFASRPVTLQSSVAGTARIATITGTLNNATNVTTQTYIPGGRRAYRFLGHPFTSALTMASLIDNIYVTGDGTTTGTGGSTAGTGFDATTTNAASSWWYDDATSSGKAFISTTDNSWSQYRGIKVLVRGDRTQTPTLTGGTDVPNAVTLDMAGAVNTGAQTISLPTAGAYHFVSNPYPSPVDIGTVIGAATNIGTQYWVWNANASTKGAYVTKTVGSGAYNLAMNSAFFVQPTATTSLSFAESNKVSSATDGLFRTSSIQDLLELNIMYKNVQADNIFIRNLAIAISGLDAQDGEKLSNPDMNMYTLSATSNILSLDSRPITSSTVIPLGFTTTVPSSFTLGIVDNGLNASLEIYIKDKLLNTEQRLQVGAPFTFTTTTDPATQGDNRFELVFRSNSSLPVNILNVSAAQKNAGIEVNWNTASETNMDSYEVEESINAITFTKATTVAAKNGASNAYSWFDATVSNSDNYYRIKAIEKNGTVKYSNVVKVKIGNKAAEFTVYPNPVKEGIVSLQMSNVDKGVYTVKIYNNIGQEVANKTITSNGGNTTETITLGKGIAKGNYKMQITNGTTTVTKSVIVE